MTCYIVVLGNLFNRFPCSIFTELKLVYSQYTAVHTRSQYTPVSLYTRTHDDINMMHSILRWFMFKFISSCLPIRKEKKSVKQVICLELPNHLYSYTFIVLICPLLDIARAIISSGGLIYRILLV